MIVWSDTNGRSTDKDSPSIVVNVASKQALLEDLGQHFAQGKGFCLATLNLDHVVKINAMPAFRTAYAAHSHVTADGNPIVWLSRLVGHHVELIPGSELIEPLVALAARVGARIAFVGATEETLRKAAEALEHKYPNVQIVAQIAPPMGFEPTGPAAQACIEDLKEAQVDLCFLAFGAPKQELFAAHAHAQMPRTGFVSIGAGLDFIAGTQVRAPRFVRAMALEWAWRLLGNPARLARRYGECLALLPRLLWVALRRRAKS